MQEAIKHISLFWFMALLAFNNTYAQNEKKSPRNQLKITHDNDFFLTTDRYYSFGFSIAYTRALENGFFENGKEQFEAILIQQAYTPSNTETLLKQEMDRPYAGFLGLESKWSLAKSSSLYEASLLFGMVGPSSGASDFQRWYHGVIDEIKPSWTFQIEDKFHTNLMLHYSKEWHLVPVPFGISFAFQPTIALGTKDCYAESMLSTFFGRKSILENSMAYNQIGNLEREIYFSLEFAYRYLSYNDFLKSNEIEKNIFLFNFNFHHRYLTNEYRVSYHYISKEAIGLTHHKYMSVSYAKSF